MGKIILETQKTLEIKILRAFHQNDWTQENGCACLIRNTFKKSMNQWEMFKQIDAKKIESIRKSFAEVRGFSS